MYFQQHQMKWQKYPSLYDGKKIYYGVMNFEWELGINHRRQILNFQWKNMPEGCAD